MFVGDAYSWEKELQRGDDQWVDFNKEAQGKFLEDIYTDGELMVGGVSTGQGGGVFYDAVGSNSIGRFVFNSVDHTDRANNGVAVVRGAKAIRLSGLFS